MSKVAFLGSKEIGYYALNYLINNVKSLQIEIVAALSNDREIGDSNARISELAKENKIPFFSSADDLFHLGEIDFLISIQYHEILAQKHIDCAKKLAVNLHMAPLPEYRGCNQFSFAIIDQARTFGTTLHVLESGIDSGDILFENRFAIADDETVTSLYNKTLESSKTLFSSAIAEILTGNYTRIAQSAYYTNRPQGFHLRKEIHSIKLIDLNWSEEKIDRHVRATYFPPFDPPFAVVNGQKISLSLNWRNEIPR